MWAACCEWELEINSYDQGALDPAIFWFDPNFRGWVWYFCDGENLRFEPLYQEYP